jgi:hypothetical protein
VHGTAIATHLLDELVDGAGETELSVYAVDGVRASQPLPHDDLSFANEELDRRTRHQAEEVAYLDGNGQLALRGYSALHG